MMNKKSIIIIVLIIILALLIGFIIYSSQFNQEQISVGEANFIMPKGYHEGIPNSLGDNNITNEKNTIYLTECKDVSIEKYLENYKRERLKSNQTVSNSNFLVENTVVYKSTNDMTGASHFWFNKNNKTYSIYTFDDYNIDEIVVDLIKNMN